MKSIEIRKCATLHRPAAISVAAGDPDPAQHPLFGLQRALGNAQVARELAQRGTATISTTLQRKGGKSPPAGQVVFEPVEPATYDVEATTLQEAAAAIEGRDEAGLTTWEPQLSYELNDQGVVTKATITVKITVEMPKWPGAENLGPKAKAEWQRFYRALAAHEQGHVDRAKSKLNGLAARLIGKTEAKAQAALEQATAKLQEQSDKYDAKTDHGRKTGTILNVDIQ